jgi:hypothetical protein
MKTIQHAHIFGDLTLYCELEYDPPSPGNPDPESPTCCPPSPAVAYLTSTKIGGWDGIDIWSVLAKEVEATIEEAVICSLS